MIFLDELPWKKVSLYNKNNKIKFLEVGAGKGVYTNLLNNLLINNLVFIQA